jgi:hypothetical protein
LVSGVPRKKEVPDDDDPLPVTPISPSTSDAPLNKHLPALLKSSIGREALMTQDKTSDHSYLLLSSLTISTRFSRTARDKRLYVKELLL